MSRAEVETVLRCYPQIYFACHRRHVRDEKTNGLLSAHQAGILDHLDDVEGTSLLELARHMGVTASTMSLTVDRLERGGYVRRARSQQQKAEKAGLHTLLTLRPEVPRQVVNHEGNFVVG